MKLTSPMRRSLKFLAWGFVLLGIFAVACELLVKNAAASKTFGSVEQVTGDGRVAVVLGCSKKLANGRENRFFKKRIDAAVALFKAGKCPAIIVSGDNSTKDYDEPTDMKEALVAAGIPEAKIYCDYAGFRTLDSMVRAKEIFGQSKIIVVSQRFHNERAIYLASNRGIDAIGFNAVDANLTRPTAIKNAIREVLARMKAVLDAHLLDTKPKFLGPKVQVVME